MPVKFARDAFLPAAVVAVPAAVLLGLGWFLPGGVLLAAAAGILYFFRDPERVVPQESGLVVSPADGRVVGVERLPAAEDQEPQVRVSIFLSLFNVHVNRVPVSGEVESVAYTAGSFLPAFDDKASHRNEQNRVRLRSGPLRLDVVQIAGLIARRIVCRAQAGDRFERGERFGLIKFGSRVDLYLPETIELRVQVGDRVRGGSSVIARLADLATDRA